MCPIFRSWVYDGIEKSLYLNFKRLVAFRIYWNLNAWWNEHHSFFKTSVAVIRVVSSTTYNVPSKARFAEFSHLLFYTSRVRLALERFYFIWYTTFPSLETFITHEFNITGLLLRNPLKIVFSLLRHRVIIKQS